MQHRDETWWTYLDGEMTPAESAAFDQSLTAEERQRLERELLLERELGDVLSAPVPCPRDTWMAAKTAVKRSAREHRRRPRWVRWSLLAGLPVAALLGIGVLAVFPEQTEPQPLFMTLSGKNVSDIAAHSQVADGVAGVRALMQQCALPIALDPADPLDGETTPYRLVGAREDSSHGEKIVQLFFDCDGQAAVLVIAKGAGWAADEIGKAFAKGDIRAARTFGNVVVAVAGANAPRDLIHVVNDDWPAPEPMAADVDQASPSPNEPQVTTPVSETPSQETPSEPEKSTEDEAPVAVPPPEAGPESPPVIIDDYPSTLV